jgi:hypothetical protein
MQAAHDFSERQVANDARTCASVPPTAQLLKDDAHRNRIRLRAPDDVRFAVRQPIRAEQSIVRQNAERLGRHSGKARWHLGHLQPGNADRCAEPRHVMHRLEQPHEQIALQGV